VTVVRAVGDPGEPDQSARAVDPPVRQARLLSPEATAEDGGPASTRPTALVDLVGQPEVKAQLQVALTAARQRGEALEHLLLHGPPGLGKTTLAQIAAYEMGSRCHVTSAPGLERPRDLAGFLARLEPGDVLFIDEIHRLTPVAEELLYPAMEDFVLDLVLGKGTTAQIRRVPLPRFTLVGATTRAGALSSPLRHRFGLVARLRFYAPEDMAAILLREAGLLGLDLQPEGAVAIGSRSRGTPRVGLRLLRRVRDHVQVRDPGPIDEARATAALAHLEIDDRGLDDLDREVLATLLVAHRGGPVGMEALAAAVGLEAATLEDVVEPYLIQAGFLQRTPRGRQATPLAWRHMGLGPDPGGQESLAFPS